MTLLSNIRRVLPLFAALLVAVISVMSMDSCRHSTQVQIDTVIVHDTLCQCDSSWRTTYTNQTSGIIELQFLSPTLGYAVGMNGLVVRTTDGGQSWTEVTPTSSGWLYGVHFFDRDNGLVVGDDAVAYRTADGGQTWSAVDVGASDKLRALSFFDKNLGFVMSSENGGVAGSIYRTTDGGRNWTQVYHEDIGGLYSITMHSAQFGVAIGKNGVVLYTINGGANWNAGTSELGIGSQISHARYVDASTIYAVGFASLDTVHGVICTSTDAGRSWSVLQHHDFGIQALAYDNARGLTAAGYRGQILQSEDLGLTWRASNFGTERWICAVYADAKHLVMAGGNNYGNGHIAVEAMP